MAGVDVNSFCFFFWAVGLMSTELDGKNADI